MRVDHPEGLARCRAPRNATRANLPDFQVVHLLDEGVSLKIIDYYVIIN